MTIGYYTVVYRVDGEEAAHDAWWQSIRPLFMSDSEPIAIITISKVDEVRRLDLIREISKRGGDASDMVDAIRALLNCAELPP